MKINFTKKQFETLLKIVYLGNWLANAIRGGQGGPPRIKKFDELEKYIFSFAKDFGLEKYIHIERDKIYPSIKLEEDEEIQGCIDDYNDENFWEDLVYKLARRDLLEKYGEETVRKMDFKERIEKEHPFLEKYYDEIGEHGLMRLKVDDKS
jgi:hypothetical protein